MGANGDSPARGKGTRRPGGEALADTMPSPVASWDSAEADTVAGGTPAPTPSPPSAGSGERFARGAVLGGRYEIRDLLGSGGMGAVYSAFDRLVEQEVALKFVRPALAHDANMRKLLRHEVQLTQKITNLHVARTYTLEEIDGHLFIVMELLRGETLSAVLGDGALPVERALGIADDLLEGLAAAHARGVIHRDIKPANIKLCDDGRVVLMDFGLARINEVPAARITGKELDSKTHTALGGTPGFIAPEVVRGEKADARADLYSFGVVLFHMLAGRAPYEADKPFDLVMQHVEQPVPDLAAAGADVPGHIADLVGRLLAKRPEERPGTAAEARAALAAPGQDSHRRVPALAWVAGAALLAAGALGVYAFGGSDSNARQPAPAATSSSVAPAPAVAPAAQIDAGTPAAAVPPDAAAELAAPPDAAPAAAPKPSRVRRPKPPSDRPHSDAKPSPDPEPDSKSDPAAEKWRRKLELEE